MDIIFLDHFGVMALSEKGIERSKDKLPHYTEFIRHQPFENFDKEAVSILNSLIKEFDLEIVVTSDWRNLVDLDFIGDFYIKQGITKRPIGFIPSSNGIGVREKRANGILEWLKSNKVENWVAVDDLYMDLPNLAWIKYPGEGIKQEGIVNIISNFLKCHSQPI